MLCDWISLVTLLDVNNDLMTAEDKSRECNENMIFDVIIMVKYLLRCCMAL
jgi:hypothetical protein